MKVEEVYKVVHAPTGEVIYEGTYYSCMDVKMNKENIHHYHIKRSYPAPIPQPLNKERW